MPPLRHFDGQGHYHYLTENIYRRVRIFDSDRFKHKFILLIGPSAAANPSQIMQKLSERTANFILRNLRQNLSYPWCQKMLKRFELAATVHHHAHYRVWNRRGYDMNIWSDKKQNEKIDYIHNNPAARGLVVHPGVTRDAAVYHKSGWEGRSQQFRDYEWGRKCPSRAPGSRERKMVPWNPSGSV